MSIRHAILLGLCVSCLPAFAATDAVPLVKLTDAQRQAAGLRTDPVRVLDAAELRRVTAGGIQLQGRVVVPSGAISVILSSVNGQLEELFVSPGQPVAVGTPLARLYSGELLPLQADYLNAAAQSEVESARLARDESLFKDGIISQSRLMETRAAEIAAAAALQEHRQLLRQAGMSEVAITALKSPADMNARITISARMRGVLLEQGVAAGGRVQSGDALFRIGTQAGLALELQAIRADAARLKAGDPVSVEGCAATGRITSVGSQVDATTQLVLVRASISASPSCLSANQYVRAAASPLRESGGALSVASAAIVRIGEKDNVFVQVRDGYQPRPVTVVQSQGERTWVRAPDLTAGTIVVTQGVAALKGQLQGLGPAAAAAP